MKVVKVHLKSGKVLSPVQIIAESLYIYLIKLEGKHFLLSKEAIKPDEFDLDGKVVSKGIQVII